MSTSMSPALSACLNEIESRLSWGPSAQWDSHDFEELADLIEEKTGRALGATTLKRVWGRVRYDSSPSRHTLDTLALFVDADSWRAFQSQLPTDASTPPVTEDVPESTSATPTDSDDRNEKRPVARWAGSAIASVAVLLVLIWAVSEQSDLVAEPTQTDVSFSSRAVSSGLPNSVVFDYRLGGVEADSFFIQQSWDARLRDRIDPTKEEFTSIYYYPGHFWAKLVANDDILQEHPLIIPTEGWDALINRGGDVPIYLESESGSADEIRLGDAWAATNLPTLHQGEHIMNWYHVGQFDPLPSRSVVLKVDARIEVDPAFSACKDAMIVLMGQHGRVAVPLAIPGCASGLNLVASDRSIDGSQRDMSGLGVDLSSWTPIQIGIQDRMVFVRIDGEDAFSTPFTEEMGNIVGLRFAFRGEGMLRNVSLSGEDQTNVLAAD